MIWPGQCNMCRSHFSQNLTVCIYRQRNKGSHLGKRGQILILIGSQDRDDCSPISLQLSQELGGHALSIYNDALDLSKYFAVFISGNDRGQADDQMLISTVCRGKQGMPLVIMQQHQSAASQDSS